MLCLLYCERHVSEFKFKNNIHERIFVKSVNVCCENVRHEMASWFMCIYTSCYVLTNRILTY